MGGLPGRDPSVLPLYGFGAYESPALEPARWRFARPPERTDLRHAVYLSSAAPSNVRAGGAPPGTHAPPAHVRFGGDAGSRRSLAGDTLVPAGLTAGNRYRLSRAGRNPARP
jgi:hypothetical protein